MPPGPPRAPSSGVRHGPAGVEDLTSAQEGSLTWGLLILAGTVSALGSVHVAALLPKLEPLVEAGLQVSCATGVGFRV